MFEKASRTTAPGAITASGETRRSNHQKHYGKRQATRKNPHAIAVGSGLDMPVKRWYITWIAI
jgi:hypothetical protein